MSIAVPPEYRDKPLFGREVPWKEMEGEVLRAVRLIPLADLDNEVRKHSKAYAWALMEQYNSDCTYGDYTPILHRLQFRRMLYALLEVECPGKLAVPSYIPVYHRFDFIKLCSILLVAEHVAPDEEVLVGYPLPIEGLLRKALRSFMPRLQVIVKPKGYLERQYENRFPGPEGWAYWQRTPRYLRDD